MATPNPLERTHPTKPPSLSKSTYTIGGILTTVYGLSELPAENKNVACLWLLHPRLQTQECMEPLASSFISHWNKLLKQRKSPNAPGLIAISFDQRNHGSRQIDPLANEAWRSGNPRHAQDMFSIYHGTALDTSHILTYLPSYIFPASTTYTLTIHLVLGISLGGHSVWHCLLSDPRITAGIAVIGCPDYFALMSDRARLSKLPSYTTSTPPGASFANSQHFPPALVAAVEAHDPAGLFLRPLANRTSGTYKREPSQEEQERLLPLMRTSLGGKRILNLAGRADKLVPYTRSEPFLGWLKRAIAPEGWFGEGGVVLEDIVFEGVGHEMSPEMVRDAVRFVVQTLEGAEREGQKSKM